MPAKIDITGQRFGKLVAVKPTAQRNNNGQILWRCKCDCGNTTMAQSGHLRNLSTRSCGCLYKEAAIKRGRISAIDITGKRFGRLIALRSTSKRQGHSVVWECSCDCGNIYLVKLPSLKSGATKSCGCLNMEVRLARNVTDLTGQRFGKLVVVSRDIEHQVRGAHWLCKCDCGNMTTVKGYSLRKRRFSACGCLRDEGLSIGRLLTRDITDQRFGRLLALEPTSKKIGGCIAWRCKCDCGETILASVSYLTTGDTKSCGCLRDAVMFSRHTNINPMDVPFAITDTMKARREIKKFIKQAS